LFILVTCRGQYDLYLPSFSSAASTFSSSKISLFLLYSKHMLTAVHLGKKNHLD
jgi:hypothetical protein